MPMAAAPTISGRWPRSPPGLPPRPRGNVQKSTVKSNRTSAGSRRRTRARIEPAKVAPMTEPTQLQPMPSPEPSPEARVDPTIADVDELVGPATPHFAMQLRARVRALVRDLPADDPVRRHGEEQIALLERLAFATSKAEEGPLEPPTRPGWDQLPSHATAADPQAR